MRHHQLLESRSFSTRRVIGSVVAGVMFMFIPLLSLVGVSPASGSTTSGPKPTIVLVHGAWADGSSWNRVLFRLQADGYMVDVPPNPLRGPSEDSAYLSSFLATISGPIVLVGHSYGGFVITDAATGNSNVKALVYVDAFIPAAGETLLQLTAGSCLSGNPGNVFNAVPYAAGVDLYIKGAASSTFSGFDKCFANGVPGRRAAALAATQEPIALSALSEPSTSPAWASIPSWSVIGTQDQVIPPASQEMMSKRADAQITTVPAGHLSLITQPSAVTHVIEQAAAAS